MDSYVILLNIAILVFISIYLAFKLDRLVNRVDKIERLADRVVPSSECTCKSCKHYLLKTPDEHEPYADYIDDGESEIADSLESELSINEKVLLREAEFDKRISALKAGTMASYESGIKSREANPLHPDVKNLPHELVDLKYASLPDVEISDDDK